jgi:hypothetical protein
LWVSKDDGGEWTDLTEKIPGVPEKRAIPRIECSHFDAGTAFVVIDRHRNDDFKPYIFRTTDYGANWTSLANNLPPGAVVGVVRQSSKAKDLLFVGTELGLYASLDGGAVWHRLDRTGLPKAVRVDDLVIHPHERELVIGTHGRGIWVMDVAPLEQLSSKVLAADAHLFEVRPVALVRKQDRPEPAAKAPPIPKGAFTAPNPPAGITVHFLTAPRVAGKVAVTCKDPTGKQTGLYLGKDAPGLDSVVFDVKEPGEYTISLKAGEVVQTKKVKVAMETAAKVED